MKKPVFTGAAVAIITPMHADGSVNYDELGRIIEDQIAHSTDAIVICGTTGESPTMTDEEHTECIRYAVKKVAGRVPVVAGTGSNDTKYAIWLSQQAEADGADALLLVTPYYNKASQAGLIAHYTAIADAVHLPCILYNVPSRTGCNLTPATLAELAKHPNINAVKEASGNISQVAEIAALCGDELNLYSGNDDQIIPLLALGGMLFQDLRIFTELTALENVQLKNNLTGYKKKKEVLAYFEQLGIADKINVKVGKLSFGQQQRVAFIRALCQPFDFLFLDEPISHLDNDNSRIMGEIITAEVERQGAGVIATSIGKHIDLPYDHIFQL